MKVALLALWLSGCAIAHVELPDGRSITAIAVGHDSTVEGEGIALHASSLSTNAYEVVAVICSMLVAVLPGLL